MDNRIERELTMHRRLEEWLASIATGSEAASVGPHLGDLYGASEKLHGLIGRLPDLDPIADRESIRQLLMTIHVELYSHVLPHMEELRDGYESWMQRLFDEVPDDDGDDVG